MSKKRIITVLITLIMAIGMCSTQIYASEVDSQYIIKREIIYYEDGYSLETIIYQSPLNTYSSNTTSGTKRATYKNDNIELWSVSVHGTFTYSGRSSLCTSASSNAESYAPDWKIIDKNCSYSKNQATGTGTAQLYVGLVPISTNSLSVVLTCDVDGNLS